MDGKKERRKNDITIKVELVGEKREPIPVFISQFTGRSGEKREHISFLFFFLGNEEGKFFMLFFIFFYYVSFFCGFCVSTVKRDD